MTVIEKVDYLLKRLNLTERQFAYKFRIRKGIIHKWRVGQAIPRSENVKYLCEQFGFSVPDFLDDGSTLNVEGGFADEHIILGKIKKQSDEANEDFPHEDNFRYEEKD